MRCATLFEVLELRELKTNSRRTQGELTEIAKAYCDKGYGPSDSNDKYAIRDFGMTCENPITSKEECIVRFLLEPLPQLDLVQLMIFAAILTVNLIL